MTHISGPGDTTYISGPPPNAEALPPIRPERRRGRFNQSLLIFGVVLVVVAGVLVVLIRGLNQGSPATRDVAGPGAGPSAATPGPDATAGPSAGTSASPGATVGPSASRTSGSGPRTSNSGSGQKAPTPTLAGWPDASNTGVPSGTALTTVNGDMTIKTAGTVVSGKDIHGCVFVEADNVTIKNSRVTCPDAYGIRGFNGSTDYAGLKIQDSELDGQNQGFTGIAYSNFTAIRLNIHGFENGFALGANVTIQDTYVHDLKLVQGTSHPDDIQTNDGGDNYVIEHNTLMAPITNSAIALCCTSGDMVSNVLIDNNYLVGGGYTLYCPRQSTSGVKVTNNKFGDDNFGPTSHCGAPGVATFTNNTFASSGQPVGTG